MSKRFVTHALRAVAAVAAGFIGVWSLGPIAASAAAAAGASGTTVLTRAVLPGLDKLTNLGAVSPDQPVTVDITFRHDQAAILRAIDAMYTPGNPAYHRWLTASQFDRSFGASPASILAAREFLARGGLAVTPGYGDQVVASGTAAQVERTFGVQLDRYRYRGRVFYANTAAPTVPAAIGIDGVEGLESFHRLSTPNRTGGAVPAQASCEPTGSACFGLANPQDLWSAYSQPGDDLGQGATVGMIGEGQTGDVITALRQFEQSRGLPFVPVQVVHVIPNGDYSDDGGRVEWELDTQAETGMAPQVRQLYMYMATSLQLSQLSLTLQTWANDPTGPSTVSASLGICESNPAVDFLFGVSQRADEVALAKAAAAGRSFFASTGDTGAGCLILPALVPLATPPIGPIPSQGVPINGAVYGEVPDAEYPSTSAFATAVGGTALYLAPNGSIADEHAWDHTGGSPSHFLAAPSWEAASPLQSTNPCTVDSEENVQAGQFCRISSDVAALSGDGTILADHKLQHNLGSNPGVPVNGYDIVDCSGTDASTCSAHFSEGGTSLSSPLWAGMWTRAVAASATPLGLAAPAIYNLMKGWPSAAGANTVNDVTRGANPLPALPGWDYPTGWGSPNLTNLVKALDANSTTPVNDVQPGTVDPPVITAAAPGGCATLQGVQGDAAAAPATPNQGQMDIVEGDFGLTPDGSRLRTVLTLANLTSNPPAGFNEMTYDVFWGAASPWDGVEVTVVASPAGAPAISYAAGQESVDSSGSNYTFAPAADQTGVTGSFDSGANGRIEVDVPLSAFAYTSGTVLKGMQAYTAEAASPPSNPVVGGLGLIIDQDGPGTDYTIGSSFSCLDQPNAAVPEAPLAGLLPLAGLAVVGAAAVAHRRREASRAER